ncbi:MULTISPECIES: hypothetical protein [Bacillus]|uniref:Uncharacterized protein n=1 Tax=Bacillus amyloliquefaciens (strain ATCC 23350 / DSM 7 / BCRC 11601 / CCUG 28519 / NBRC 15535 / NRRL B-14393 / F) TaxID=692420 RepID=A0A9P1JI31_BACAS|nr:hypothetical protein [Bacillus amyloliquefaciens]AIW34174.1 hypothetical protein KS08_11190 [Bacillus subtilis]AEB23360.1 hypothetical protein BAMTA208_05895 [Bacillus amyloliquefaciens TA208]ARW39377.1 Cell wall-binding protein YqgA [Bacillus amyloliquefaciens]AZV89585.1 hypothetical protein BUN12_1325 [Bacillus amyloliquefaciens]MBW8279116.1 hypothetical protein [Bacillus amyloliquefaciens]
MKKVSKILMGASALLIAGSTFICSPKAEAAMSSWQTVHGIKGCEARVWTDATTYTRNATSIDVYAQTNGKCGTLNYRMGVTTLDGEYNIGDFSYKGSFSNKTPVKKFYFSKLLKPGFKERWQVNVELYKGGKMKDAVQSKTIYVEKRK